jgi:uncharacterized protein YkwD
MPRERSTPARFPSFGALALVLTACASPSRSVQPVGQTDSGPVPAESRVQPVRSTGVYGPEPAANMTALERETYQALRSAHPGIDGHLRHSASLSLAARRLAERIARGETWPAGNRQLRDDLAAGLSFDPAPLVQLVSAKRAAEIPDAVARAVSPAQGTSIGIGAASAPGMVHAVVLLSHREVKLRPFPREVALGERRLLEGELGALSTPRVFVTLPSGEAQEVGRSRARSFEAALSFDQKGRYLVEVLGHGPSGPEVAALLAVFCGGDTFASAPAPDATAEPVSVSDAEAQVLAAIQKARARLNLPPLRLSDSISAVARRHSQAMRSAGRLAHVLPGSGDAGQRLRSASVPYRRVLENVALAPSSLVAHQTAEESPAHLRNILDPRVTEIGCGVARGTLPGGGSGVYLTEIFVEEPEPESAGGLSPEGVVREALWREREKLGQAPLLSDPRLDDLAREAARAMLRQNEPSAGSLGHRALELGRKSSAVDVFVAASPREAVRSPNLKEARYRRVGVGVAVGDTPRFGAGRYWIAVVYTD